MKSNGMRIDKTGGGIPLIGAAAGTPESLTLSVDSLTQRQIYQGDTHRSSQGISAPTWKRSPIIDITATGVRRMDRPPPYPIQKVL